jgi:hypothetical protein
MYSGPAGPAGQLRGPYPGSSPPGQQMRGPMMANNTAGGGQQPRPPYFGGPNNQGPALRGPAGKYIHTFVRVLSCIMFLVRVTRFKKNQKKLSQVRSFRTIFSLCVYRHPISFIFPGFCASLFYWSSGATHTQNYKERMSDVEETVEKIERERIIMFSDSCLLCNRLLGLVMAAQASCERLKTQSAL